MQQKPTFKTSALTPTRQPSQEGIPLMQRLAQQNLQARLLLASKKSPEQRRQELAQLIA